MNELAYYGKYSITGLEPVNIAKLYQQENWLELNSIVISCSQDGKPISVFLDDEWDLSPYHHRHSQKSITNIKFDFIKNAIIKRELKLAVYGLLHFPVGQKGMLKSITVKIFSDELKIIAYHMEVNGCKSFTELDNFIFIELLRKFGEKLSQNSLYLKIVSINKVHLLAQHIGYITPVYVPKPRCFAKKYSIGNNQIVRQYAALPTNILINLMSYLCDQIEAIDKYLPSLVKAHEEFLVYYEIRKQNIAKCNYTARTYQCNNLVYKDLSVIIENHLFKTPFWRFCQIENDGRHIWPYRSLQKIITWCNQVCFLTCIAFTGMRRSDALELKKDSFRELVLSDGTRVYVLNGKTFKTADGQGKPESWVTSEVTKKAIECVTLLSSLGRKKALDLWKNNTKDRDQIRFERMVGSIWLGYKCGVTLRSFGDFKYLLEDWDYRITPADLKEHQVLTPYPVNDNYEIGGRWPLSPHQLRRSLIVFAIRYDLATVPAFKQQYKHLCASMTRHYARQAGAAAWLDIANGSSSRREMVDALQREKYEQQSGIDYELHKNEAKLYGKGGENILRMRESGALPLIYRSKEDVLKAHKSGRISLHRTFIGWCNAGYQCNMKSIFDVTGCYQHKCEHLIMTESDKESLKRMHKSLQNTFVELNDEQQKSSYFTFPIISEIRALEHVMTELCVDHEKWQQPEAIIHE